MKTIFYLLFTFNYISILIPQTDNQISDADLYKKAVKLCKEFTLIDSHIDLPGWLYDEWFDVTQNSNKGEIDYPRAIQGGLDIPFMAIYTLPSLEGTRKSKIVADSMINLVHKMAALWPDKFTFVRTTSDIESSLNKNKVLLAMGIENGSPIESSLDNLREFYDKGVRYITLAHYRWNHICDSANDTIRKWNGLSPFGEEVVKEMNKLGMMVDISHVSDSTFYDVMRLSNAPVIASHSCCRVFTPGYERNMNDEMIKAIAKNGGVIQLAFANFFLREDVYKAYTEGEEHIKKYLRNNKIRSGTDSAWQYEEQYWKENPLPDATVKDVADHIDHIKKLVGIDYVGIGSDFNGTGGLLAVGLEDVSKYPNLVYELLQRGYSDEDIKKVLGDNLLRVWKDVETTAKNLR